ncbi:DUF1963 domain-containing protein [Paenibacillus donghaensis]|uniref:DUF1963 domain-containing protein n=1 Tax=Paenibacillus donghaensis TaxID=414771 RepID=A0A2Z2KHS5_9BACL|nr:YwqG family protein [Paenibacillus donghaensis]ASA20422.1 hypothetical protein B9T62_06155 [Paenibacillus donghaensis]
MPLHENNRNKLERLIEEHDFSFAAQYVLEHTRQGICWTKKGPSDYSTPCSSRIGGDPDLLPATVWPITSDGIPMTFLAQLNLKQLSEMDESAGLQGGGMLYFFVGVDEPAYNIEHHVLFLPESKLPEAHRCIPPEVTALEEKFSGYEIEPLATLEAPNYGYVDYEAVEDDQHDFEDYEELREAMRGGADEAIAVMFGYPATQHGDCEVEAALMLLTGQNYNYRPAEALQQITAHLGGDEERAKQEVQDTLLLLEIDSDDDVGFCWWDAGTLQFFVRKEDLLAGRWDRTYCSLYSS